MFLFNVLLEVIMSKRKRGKEIVEFICEGGFGGEARIRVELRTIFPGLGGTIKTAEGVASAFRMEKKPFSKKGHLTFLRHMIAKKLDDFFFRTGKYMYSHVPRPFGSFSKIAGTPCEQPCEESCPSLLEQPCEAYLYEWVFGTDCYSVEELWRDDDGEYRYYNILSLDNFECSNCFNSAGININQDSTTVEDARISKNIVQEHNVLIGKKSDERSPFWKRIDFGMDSFHFDWKKLNQFLSEKRPRLVRELRAERYEMLLLAVKFLTEREKITDREIGFLEALIGDYRRESMTQFAMEFGPVGKKPEFIGPITESLI